MKSICLTAKVQRWILLLVVVLITGDKNTWDEEGEECHRCD
jgi:hypothetical protein